MAVAKITGLLTLDQDELGPLREIYETFETQSAGEISKVTKVIPGTELPMSGREVIHCKCPARLHFDDASKLSF